MNMAFHLKMASTPGHYQILSVEFQRVTSLHRDLANPAICCLTSQIKSEPIKQNKKNCPFLFTLSNENNGESIVIGLAASSTSKGPQVDYGTHGQN